VTRRPVILTVLLLAAAAIAGPTAPVAAQQEAPADASTSPVDAALVEWEKVATKSTALRMAALTRLAAFDDERVTVVLMEQLRAEGVSLQARRVLDLIALKPRGNIVPELRDLLTRPDAPPLLRQSTARAIGRQGNYGIDLLADIARNDDGKHDDALVTACELGLAAAADDRAWRALAALALRGGNNVQLRRLRLLDPARNVSAVTQARLKLVEDSDLALATAAWRGLAAEKNYKADRLLDDLIERVGANPPPPARADLVVGMAHVLPESAFPAFLRYASAGDSTTRGALRAAAPELGKNAALVRWLVTSGLDSDVPDERQVALAVLKHAPAASLQALLTKIRAGLKRPSRDTLEQAMALNELLAKDPTWKDDLLQLLRGNDAGVRTFALALLL